MKLTEAVIVGFSILLYGCETLDKNYTWKKRQVTASAYNSVPSQTDGQHNLAAWGDTLKPGMKVIAVSRDLIPLGLDYDTHVKIEGLDGVFLVKDKMHYRWRNRIDLYMGQDIERAKKWGRQKVEIMYRVKKDTLKMAK